MEEIKSLEKIKSQWRIVSNTPGRLRLRLHHPKSQLDLVSHVETHLKGRAGVQRIDTNPAIGSVTIGYDIQTHSHDTVLDMLREGGMILQDVVTDREREWLDTGHCRAATQINSAIKDFDRRIFRLTGGKVDLKLALPLAMGILGLRQTIRNGLGISQIPGYVLIWYAFDAFYRLHQDPQKTQYM